MSLLDGLLGAGASGALFGVNSSQQRTYDDALDASRSAQIQAQYSQAQQARFNAHKWVFNGKPCTLQQFADSIWPGEHEDKMLFLLTHSGPPVAESSR